MKRSLLDALAVGVVAGGATWLVTVLQFPTWLVFLTWVAYFLFGSRLGSGANMYALFVAGAGLALGVQGMSELLASRLGAVTTPALVLALVTCLMLLEGVKGFNLIPAYFLGMVAAFAYQLTPAGEPIFQFVLASAMGVVLGWLTVLIRDWLKPARSATSPVAPTTPHAPIAD